jgi:predicted dehydrogenase
LFAKLHTFVAGRPLDDDGMVLFELQGGATGTLVASQVCVGQENGLRLRLFGSDGGLAWSQEEPNELRVFWKDRPPELRRTGNGWIGTGAKALTRIPSGHPEGYLEAFANLYVGFARAIAGEQQLLERAFPTVLDGLRGVRFLEAVVESHHRGQWVEL